MPTATSPLAQLKTDAILRAGAEEFAVHAYADANTERIAADCGISKGLLYHYFGTKKNLYLACVRHALDTLTRADEPPPEGGFYATLFAAMESKLRLCAEHPTATKLLNMASREAAREIKAEKDALIGQYAAQVRARSERTMGAAVAALPLKRADAALATRGLTLYVNALVSRYLVLYQDTPEAFFAREKEMIKELKAYIDLMLYGVCREEKA